MRVHWQAVVGAGSLKLSNLRENLKLPSTLLKINESTLHGVSQCCIQHGEDGQVSAKIRHNATAEANIFRH